MPRSCLVQGYEDGTVKNCFISGKAFYLDLPNNKNTKFLEDVVKKLGGTIESFLSKEVSYVISNREAKLGSKSANSASVPNREYSKNYQARSSQSVNPRDGQTISRGKRLLETVIKNNECGGSNSILANARSWGMKILHLDDLLAYFEKRGVKELLNANRKTEGNGHSPKSICKSTKVEKLKQPFLKIEDSSRHFRPLYQQCVSYPELNYESHRRFSAFDPLKKSRNGRRGQEKSKLGDCRMTNSEGDVETLTKPAAMHIEKKRQRFCECCHETFYDLVGHLLSKRHQDFASDPSQFTALDGIASQLENEFVEFQSNGCTQRSMKSVSSPGIALSKMYMESLQAVNDLVLGGEKLSLESVAASQHAHFPVENLERIDEIGQNSKVHHVKSDKTKDELTQDGLKLNVHRSFPLQDHELASLRSMNQTAVCSKQLVVKSPNCSSLDFNTGVPADRATFHVPHGQMDIGAAFVEKNSYGADKEEPSESYHQDEQEHMKSASEEILFCVEAIPNSWKVDCDIIATDTNCSFKKRKRSENTSSQIERSPRSRLDDLTGPCDCFSFIKNINCLAGNFNEHIFQPHAKLLYLSDLDKTYTSHTCVEQNMFPSACSMNISMGEHFDLSAKFNLHRPLSSKESLVDFQSSKAKNDCENWGKPQRAFWSCEEKPRNLPNTTSTGSQEVNREIWLIQTSETVLHDKEQMAIPLSSATVQAEKELLSAPQNTSQSSKVDLNDEIVLKDEAEIQITNEEIVHSNVTGNTIMQLISSFKTNAQKSLGSDTLLCAKSNFHVDENRCKNSDNQTNLCHSSFKNNIVHTDTFSSESEWDIQLPSRLGNIQAITKEQSVDLELLRKTCVSMKDAKYETQLYSVLKDKSEVDWINKEKKGLMNCQTETNTPCFLAFASYLDGCTN
ncbi:uncharacterized protein [Heterodontus francisci]|uniref:uncharacterized protein isoform X2 n=1 Tax=Heterodontus francisci TaxID=7792 RepID=UPI00355ACDE7